MVNTMFGVYHVYHVVNGAQTLVWAPFVVPRHWIIRLWWFKAIKQNFDDKNKDF